MQIQDEQHMGAQPAAEAQEAPAQPSEEEARQSKKAARNKEIVSWIVTLAAAVVIALVIRTFLFEPVRVDGESMCDTLHDGEIMFVTKPEYLFGDPQVGDVVICKYPDRKENFVKRVMGVPGDVVEVRSNVVYVNGEAVEEPYLTESRNDNGFSMAAFSLGADEYFVMGDNRDNSHDCRNMTNGRPVALTRNMIVGHVRYVLFPFNQIRGIE